MLELFIIFVFCLTGALALGAGPAFLLLLQMHKPWYITYIPIVYLFLYMLFWVMIAVTIHNIRSHK